MLFDLATISAVAGLLGITSRDVRSWFQEWQEERATIAVSAKAMKRTRLRTSGLHTTALARYYSEQRLAGSGLKHYRIRVGGWERETALATKPDWTGLRIELDGPNERSTLVARQAPHLQPDENSVKEFLQWAHWTKIRLWNAPIYRLVDLQVSRNMIVCEFAITQYYDWQFTYGLLSEELENALAENDERVDFVVSRASEILQKRGSLLSSGAQILNFAGRLVVGGPDVLFAMARPSPHNDFALVLQQRSAEVSGEQGLLAIIPMGYHQPSVDACEEVSLCRTVYREVFEELFGGDEVIYGTRRVVPDWYLATSAPMAWFGQNRGAFQMTCTNFGLSLGLGNAQFSVLLEVNSENFWTTFRGDILRNWESDSSEAAPVVPLLVSSRDSEGIRGLLGQKHWNGSSLVSFVEGLKLLEERHPDRVILPTLESGLI